ncbi:MAG: AAA family ATPase [Janthinobacterium lividum]
MRLGRLDLIRYGKFTGRSLDFGPAPVGRPDLHIVYGPNEAGKSTAFAAYLDLLFGIRALKEPNYAFLHPYPTLRIGARLDLADGSREVLRIRRQQATLLDADERALDEGLLTAELGGVGRDAYRSMFSLDDDSIEQGGDEILASRGDLGQILFSGSAGAAGLSQTLETMREEADRFFRPGAQKTGLNELKAELDRLKVERDAIDMQSGPYKRMVEERDRAAAAYDAARQKRGEAGARRDDIARRLAALPQLARLRSLRDTLAPLLALPEPPADWAAALPALERDEIRLAEEARGIARESETLLQERDAIVVDTAALALGDAHDGLASARAAAVTAAKDLPRRRPQLAEAEVAIAVALRRLGRPPGADPDGTMLPAAVVGILRALIAERSGIAARHEDARRESDHAAQRLAAAQQSVEKAGGGAEALSGAALARLAGVVEGLRTADPATQRRHAERARVLAKDRLAETIQTLAPWRGTADQLAALPLPAQRDVEGWTNVLAEAEAETLRRDGEAADLSAEQALLRAEVDALGRLAGPISDAEALALRQGRERAWAAHRARLDIATAEDFEDALRRDDAVVAARFGQAADVARLKERSLALAGLEARLGAAGARAESARQRAATVRASVTMALAGFDPAFPVSLTPAGLSAWLVRTGPVLRARTDAREAVEAVREAEEAETTWRDRLAASLTETGLRPDASDLDGLMATARAAIDRGAALDALAKEFAEAGRLAVDREAALKRTAAADADWTARWAAALQSCWLGEAGDVPSPAAVGEVLEVLAGLAPELRSRAELQHRIAAMDADAALFATRIAALASDIGLSPGSDDKPDDALVLDATLARRITAARTAAAALQACLVKLAAVEARRAEVDAARIANGARGDKLRAFFGVDTLTEVGARLKLCEERDRLRGAAAMLENDIRGGLHAADISAAETLLDGIDLATLEAERDTASGDYEAADTDLRTHHAAHVTAEQALSAVSGDDTVAKIEARRRVVLLEIEEQARHFLKLRGGISAAEQALAAYRDRHRSDMLREASRAFATISRGAYEGLAAQPSDKGEILIARSADGPTKLAADLSKGTRFQLYLALRAAGYREFARTRRAVPFVADDIMETFDDFRAEEAFRLFAEMAMVGQVIYLTHHRHLVDIARAACPDVTIHDLSPAA